MDTALLERAFIVAVIRMIENGRLAPRVRTHSDFARLAFPGEPGAVSKWKNMRIGAGTGKAKNITLSEAMKIAAAADIPLSALLTRAEILCEDGFSENDDPANNNKKKSDASMPDVASSVDTPQDQAPMQ